MKNSIARIGTPNSYSSTPRPQIAAVCRLRNPSIAAIREVGFDALNPSYALVSSARNKITREWLRRTEAAMRETNAGRRAFENTNGHLCGAETGHSGI